MTGKNKKKKIKRAATRSAQQMVDGLNIGFTEQLSQLNNQYSALAEATRAMQTYGLSYQYVSAAENARRTRMWDDAVLEQRFMSGEFDPR